MLTHRSLAVAFGLLPVGIAQQSSNSSLFDWSNIVWQPCTDDVGPQVDPTFNEHPVPIDCATLPVPLDYTDNSLPTFNISLIRIRATQKPALGNVISNPGGPGAPGASQLIKARRTYSILTGGRYNIISWNQRGTALSSLPFTCPGNYEEQKSQVPGLFAGDLNTYLDNGGWDFAVNYSTSCFTANLDIGDKLSTAFAARDMARVLDALGDDKLNFLGFSYGTFLGITFASLFPQRVGRVVLDGVINPSDWVTGNRLAEMDDVDKAFDKFLSDCVANRAKCALAALLPGQTATARDLRAAVQSGFARLVGPDADQATRVESFGTQGMVRHAMYTSNWASLARDLYEFLTNGTSMPAPPPKMVDIGDALVGISCGDTLDRATSPDEFRDVVAQQQRKGWFANWVYTTDGAQCKAWRFVSKEVYTGPFRANTSEPILFVGSAYDPVTPLESAYNASEGFAGSVVLRHNGVGHSSAADRSHCTVRYIQAYFLTGRLPPANTSCEPDFGTFERAPLLQKSGAAAVLNHTASNA